MIVVLLSVLFVVGFELAVIVVLVLLLLLLLLLAPTLLLSTIMPTVVPLLPLPLVCYVINSIIYFDS